MKKILEIQNLTYKYEEDSDKLNLSGVSFDVNEGEWISIIGRNGSGKSTTARLIDGLMPALSGTIKVDGEVLTEANVWDIRRKIGMVFQNPDNQFVGATVEDDIAFGMENQQIERDEMIKRVDDVLELVNMSDFKNREPASLSGGQKQRVAIAGVIALRPKIIILDEATSMLDPNGRNKLMNVVREIKDEYGLTVLSITHDLDEAVNSDRIVVMKDGEVVRIATPDEIFESENDMVSIGLDVPFTSNLMIDLRAKGLDIPEKYMDEEGLADYLWQSYLKK
ncbi:energy-coupling factor ABC transporter ATP-binding protein [Floricoccus penangensis]|uniref:energy-coupling factor ABC transporter ATP-binding protein n=1 Tax=Floricoccus penangensis TaxID=1859475 RepID=UPI00203E3FD1|nr:energy-coupling factor ABC transporter ATP-binding protein [Floricoccus penangensis]URZ87313.1 energy-coupling factor ABC transporter ATP-binding protein [Floricoccus penangensis]